MKMKVNSLEMLNDCLSRSSEDDFSLDDVSQQFDGYLNVFTISGSADPYDLLALDQNDYLKVAEIFYRSLGSGNRRDKLVAVFQEMAESAVKGQSLGVFTVEVSRSERVSFNTDKIPTFYQQLAEC
tara:strand:+ start:686 stop:1063 length:378 start_codon:yes stop_codon:yes gene_type:complete